MWSSFPTPYHVLANPYLSDHMVQGFAGAVPCQMTPYNHCVFINSLDMPYSNGFSPDNTRKYILNRSIFDLVRAHKFLELTDQQLLSWYLSLQVADRKLIQEEGGFRLFLQRHPAFELTHQHVYVKYRLGENMLSETQKLSNLDRPKGPMFNKVVPLENSCASGPSRAQRCTVNHRELECLPNTVRESLDLLDHSDDVRAMQQVPWNSKAQGWQEGSGNAALYEDSSAQASSSLDAELEQHCHWGAPWPALQSPPSQAQGCDPSACTEAARSYYSPSAGEHESPSEFYSLDGSQTFSSQLNHSSTTYAMEPERNTPPLATERSSETAWCDGSSPGTAQPASLSSPHFSRQAASQGDPIHDNVATCKGAVPEMDREDQEESSDFHSFLKEDKNIVVCKSSSRPEACVGRDRSTGAAGEAPHTVERGPSPSPCTEVLRNCSAAGNTGAKARTFERGTSPSPRIVTSDVSVGTETRCVSVDAQTKVPTTADKNNLTVLHMADLDYLAEEFVKLKSAKKELHELKQKLKSSEESGEREPCAGYCGRAQRAELYLLDLQYTMCQQHAWRDCFTSPDDLAMTTTHSPQDPPAKLVNVCEKLHCDYKEMRTNILAGVSLEHLEPLSVSSARLTSGCPYSPPKLIGDALEDVSTSSRPLEGWNMEMLGGKEYPLCPKSEDPKEAKGQKAPVAQSKVKCSRTVSQMPKHSGTDDKQTGDYLAVESQMEGDSTELSTSEVWYDAKEDLEPGVVMVPTGPGDIPSGSNEEIKEVGLPKKVEEQESSLLCVSGLRKDVTESDVMQWFEKDHVSEVRLCNFSNHLTVAMVTVKGPLAAELAVGKMNGVCVQGFTLHVEYIRPVTESLSPALQNPISSSQVPEETGGAPKPGATKTHSSLTVGKVPGQDKHTVLSDSPTAEGTCVPQHYATMGSFDKLMASLKERHPEAGRLAIVGALQEVRARHRGILSGLPLSSIVEMASKQLTASSSSGATAASGGSGGGDTASE